MRGVDGGEFLERLDHGLHEEGHHAQLDAVPGLELLLHAAAQAADRAHVHLVEGGEQGGRLLRVDEVLRQLLAQGGHGHALFHSGACSWRRKRLSPGSRRGRLRGPGQGARARAWRRGGRCCRGRCLEVAQHVLLEHAAAGPAAGHRARGEALLGHQPLGGRHHGCRTRPRGRGGGRCRSRPGRNCRCQRGHGRGRSRRDGARRERLEFGDRLADRGRLAGLLEDARQPAVHGRRHLAGDLVGLDDDEVGLAGHAGALGHQPLADQDLADRLAEGGNGQLHAHCLSRRQAPFQFGAKAASSRRSCSRRWLLAKPVAGLAEASR